MLENKNLFFRVESNFIGIDINKRRYLKSLCYYDFGGRFKLVNDLNHLSLKYKMNNLYFKSLTEDVIDMPLFLNFKNIINKRDIFFNFLILNEDLKLKKRYIYNLTNYYLKFWYIFKYLKIPLGFWEINDKWYVYWIINFFFYLKKKLYVLFNNLSFIKLKLLNKTYNFLGGESEEINEFLKNKSFYFLKISKSNYKFQFNLENFWFLKLKGKRGKINFKIKQKVLANSKKLENLSFLKYKECYLNRLFKNLLRQKEMYSVLFPLVKFSKFTKLSEDFILENLYYKKKYQNIFFYNKGFLYLISNFFYIILVLYKKNYLNLIDADKIKIFILKFKFILVNLIKKYGFF